MDTIDRSLYGLMRINRHRFINSQTPIVVIPIIPPDIPPTQPPPPPPQPPITQPYVTDDFGENAINNHVERDKSHSEKNQVIFNYITRNFRNRCTSYESYKTSPYNYFINDVLDACKTLKADIVYTPYTNAAVWTNTNNDNFVLTVGSHYNNDGQGDNQIGSDNNRHDITANATTFLTDSIAVSARRDTPELFKNATSEGYGMEFFEDCSPEALDPFYPDKIVPVCFSEIRTSADGLTVYGTRSMDQFFGSSLTIGEEVYIVYPDGHQEHRLVASVINDGEFTVTQALTPHVVNSFVSLSKVVNGTLTKLYDVGIEANKVVRSYGRGNASFIDTLVNGDSLVLTYPNNHTETIIVSNITRYDTFNANIQPTYFNPGGIYIWRYDTIGTYIGGQAQSWAVPLVAGKLKVIKMTTGANWDTVRAAARATAKRNTTGIPEIDNVSWDIYRGFGCIDVQAAINYINN